MIIRLLEPKDAPQVARIHAESISTGFISSLPSNFIEIMYKEIARSKYAFGFVCEYESGIIGFICNSLDTNKLFKDIIFKRGLILAIPLIKRVFSFKYLKKIINNVFYANKFGADLPRAEVLSVAVDNKVKGMGVGKKLMENAIAKYKDVHINRIKALTDEKSQASNQYYIKCGFRLTDKIKHHDHYLNIYVLEL